VRRGHGGVRLLARPADLVRPPRDAPLPPVAEETATPAPERAIPTDWRWHGAPAPPGPAVVFDIDGVLSDATSRQHFLEHGQRDWEAFFAACGDDPLIEEVARLLELLDTGLAVVLLTGRPIRVQPQTLAWLRRYGLRWDLLVMRGRGERARVTAYKRRVVTELRAYGFDLRLALEDDPKNHAMFLEEGVPCVYIHSGYYE
jgi:hypothetical protein